MEWIILIGICVASIIVSIIFRPPKCDVCGLGIKKISYSWKIGGKKQKLCPKCNSRMERKVSKEAFKSKFG
jgi:hypothetical protein